MKQLFFKTCYWLWNYILLLWTSRVKKQHISHTHTQSRLIFPLLLSCSALICFNAVRMLIGRYEQSSRVKVTPAGNLSPSRHLFFFISWKRWCGDGSQSLTAVHEYGKMQQRQKDSPCYFFQVKIETTVSLNSEKSCHCWKVSYIPLDKLHWGEKQEPTPAIMSDRETADHQSLSLFPRQRCWNLWSLSFCPLWSAQKEKNEEGRTKERNTYLHWYFCIQPLPICVL